MEGLLDISLTDQAPERSAGGVRMRPLWDQRQFIKGVTSPEKASPRSSLFPMEGLLGISLRDQALNDAPALAVCPFPAFR